MTIPKQKRQAAEDHNIKLVLESRLRAKINALNEKIIREFTASVARIGNIPNFFKYEDALEKILTQHDQLVASVFIERINRQVEAEESGTKQLIPFIKLSAEETAIGAIELFSARSVAKVPVVVNSYLTTKTSDSVSKITETTKKDAARALQKAQTIAATTAVEKVEVASLSGSIFRTKLNGRTTGIVTLNTNAAAESAKLTQIELLSGEEPTLGGAGTNRSKSKKSWANMGDSLVRAGGKSAFNHLRAEQEVQIDKPFIVSGESLRFPGDMSLGASIGNVANCRCSATYDIKKVVNTRKGLSEVASTTSRGGARIRDDVNSLLRGQLGRNSRQFARERLVPASKAGKAGTEAMFRHADGSWVASRQKLHEEIIAEIMEAAKSVKPGEKVRLQLLGGGPASGKSTLGIVAPDGSVVIDVDAIRAFLPEFRAGSRIGKTTGVFNNANAAAMTHNEASYLGGEIAKRAARMRAHVILDQVGDGKIDKFLKKLKPFLDDGYKIEGNYVTVDVEEALRRARIRALKTGRTVPEEVIRELHAGVSDTTLKILEKGDVFDEFRLVFGDKEGKEIAKIVKGKLKIVDQKLWDDFAAKAADVVVK
jgi:predicted kinase